MDHSFCLGLNRKAAAVIGIVSKANDNTICLLDITLSGADWIILKLNSCGLNDTFFAEL